MAEQLVPENRLERFLSSIVYNTDVPDERRTRLELWLGAILKRNTPPDAPYDRLERWLKEIYENADYAAQFSGLNVEFWSKGNEQIKSLIVDIAPYQDFGGYDKPWPPGTGKNFLENNVESGTYRDITSTRNPDGSLTLNGTITQGTVYIGNFALGDFGIDGQNDEVKHIPNGSYIASTGTSRGVVTLQFVGANSAGTGDATTIASVKNSGNVVIDDTYRYNWVRLYLSAGEYDNLVIKPMLRLASDSDPTYEPYANVCPITGFDSITVKRYGVTEEDNLLTVNVLLGQTIYGGTVDIITGEMNVKYQTRNLAISDMNNGDNFPGWRNCDWLLDSIPEGINESLTRFSGVLINMCTRSQIKANTLSSYGVYPLFFDAKDGTSPFGGMEETELKEKYPNLVLQIALPLITPVIYHLTSQQISTLIGTNHVKASLVNGTTEIEANITLRV